MTGTDLNWLLTAFTDRTPGVVESTVVSVDGLLIAASSGLDRATADRVAAVASSLASITRGASRVFDAGDQHVGLAAVIANSERLS